MMTFSSGSFLFKSIGTNHLQLSGYASVFGNLDHQGDIICHGAFAQSVSKHTSGQFSIKFLWQHDHKKPIGVINTIYEDQKGLFVQAQINGSVNAGQEAIELIKQKAIDSFSIGFNVSKSNLNQKGERQITECQLWEISVVTFPANCQAKMSGYKSDSIKLANIITNKAKTIFIL